MTLLSELFDDAKFIFQFRRETMKMQKRLDAQAAKAGDLAPDFTLSDVSGTKSVTLSDYRGKKPVALVFGSYT
jgi:hypothetical protein